MFGKKHQPNCTILVVVACGTTTPAGCLKKLWYISLAVQDWSVHQIVFSPTVSGVMCEGKISVAWCQKKKRFWRLNKTGIFFGGRYALSVLLCCEAKRVVSLTNAMGPVPGQPFLLTQEWNSGCHRSNHFFLGRVGCYFIPPAVKLFSTLVFWQNSLKKNTELVLLARYSTIFGATSNTLPEDPQRTWFQLYQHVINSHKICIVCPKGCVLPSYKNYKYSAKTFSNSATPPPQIVQSVRFLTTLIPFYRHKNKRKRKENSIH